MEKKPIPFYGDGIVNLPGIDSGLAALGLQVIAPQSGKAKEVDLSEAANFIISSTIKILTATIIEANQLPEHKE